MKKIKKDKLKIGDKITHVKVSLNSNFEESDIRIENHKIIGMSESFTQLDGDLFPKLSNSKTWDFCYSRIDKVSISENKRNFDIKMFGKFSISIYSKMTLKRIENKINKEFNKWLNDKLMCYGSVSKVKISLTNNE